MADEAKTPETTEAPADGADAGKQEDVERISKPSKEELDKRIEIIEEEIKNWQAKQNALHEKRKESMGGGPKTGPLADARAKFRELSTEARALREERKGYFDQLGAMRAAREKMQAQLKAMREQMGPMKSVEDMDKKIRQLEQKQSTTSMTLSQEKELVKEIETLKSMRKEAGKFEQAKSKADKGKDDGAKGDISSKLDESKEKLNALNAQMDEQKKVLDKLQQQDKSQQVRAQIPAILRELDACSAEIDGCFTRIRALRADFREKNNQWFEYSKVLRAQRAEQRAKEAEERRKAWEEKQAEIEAEEAKKVPWEEEMALCNYLITDYLSKLAGGDGAAPKAEEVSAGSLELEGMQPMKRDEDDFMVLPGAKKKKFGKKKKKATLTHSVDTVETFGVIGLTPPISLEAVPASIEAVKAKLEEYKVKPREPKKKKEQKPKPVEGEEGEAPVEKPKPKKKAPAKKYEHDAEAFPSLGGK